ILRMAAVDHVADGLDARLLMADQHHRAHALDIDLGHLLALPEIGERGGALCGRDPIGDAATGAAMIEAEHEAGTLRRAAVNEGIDAERAMRPEQARRNALRVVEARPPYERAVREHPQAFFGVIEFRVHRAGKETLTLFRRFARLTV